MFTLVSKNVLVSERLKEMLFLTVHKGKAVNMMIVMEPLRN